MFVGFLWIVVLSLLLSRLTRQSSGYFTVFFDFPGELYVGNLFVKMFVEEVDFVFVYCCECVVNVTLPEWQCFLVRGQGLLFDVLHDDFCHNTGNR